jgi:DNA repair protein RecN (Recombination protein N)
VLEDGVLIISRSISREGRNRAWAGGRLVPVSVLAETGDELVDLHGQHEHQSLLKTDRQLDLLDAFAGTEEAAADVAEQVSGLRALEKEIAALESDDRERQRQIDFMKYEIGEIEQAGLDAGEEEELRSRRNRITNAETVYTLANQAHEALYAGESGACIDLLDAALRDLGELAEIDGQFETLESQLKELRTGIETVASELRGYGEEVEYDPQELDRINQRLSQIADLKRKFGNSIEEILAWREKAAAEIGAWEQRDERLESLRAEHAQQSGLARDAAEKLSAARKKAAKKLDRQVAAALAELAMKGARFETAFEKRDLGSRGIDRVAFMLSANPGEPLKPLKQVASGGEISRIMLALKAVFAKADRIPTLIFDEIDAGVGGAVAVNVAEKLADLAKTHQVICITHIAQIAAAAAVHFRVEKAADKKHTATTVRRVEEDARIEELARLLDGSVSKVSLEHARALLEKG